MIIEFRINNEKPWQKIEPVKMVVPKNEDYRTWANTIAQSLAEAHNCEIRWNIENSLQGYYIQYLGALK